MNFFEEFNDSLPQKPLESPITSRYGQRSDKKYLHSRNPSQATNGPVDRIDQLLSEIRTYREGISSSSKGSRDQVSPHDKRAPAAESGLL